MKIAVVSPPLVDGSGPIQLWQRTWEHMRRLGVEAELLDVNALVVDAYATAENVRRTAAPLVARFETLERKAHLSPDERRRYPALARLALLAPHVIARVDRARDALRDPATYRDVSRVIRHRTVLDLAGAILRESIDLGAFRSGPALTMDDAPLREVLDAYAPSAPRVDGVILVAAFDTQVAFARTMARTWAPDGAVRAIITPREAPSLAVGELDVLAFDRLDAHAQRVMGLGTEVERSPVATEVADEPLDVAHEGIVPWSAAVRMLVDEAAPADPLAEPAREGVLAFAEATGTHAHAFVPAPLDDGRVRLRGIDVAQRAALGEAEPLAEPPETPGAPREGVPRIAAHGLVLSPRHDPSLSADGAVGVGRTAPEQIRAGLTRPLARTLVVDLSVGCLRAISSHAARALRAVDGLSDRAALVRALAEDDPEAAARVSGALDELTRAGAIEW